MARLVEVCEEFGYEGGVKAHQHRNVIFEAIASCADIECSIEDALEAAFGFEITSFVRD